MFTITFLCNFIVFALDKVNLDPPVLGVMDSVRVCFLFRPLPLGVALSGGPFLVAQDFVTDAEIAMRRMVLCFRCGFLHFNTLFGVASKNYY